MYHAQPSLLLLISPHFYSLVLIHLLFLRSTMRQLMPLDIFLIPYDELLARGVPSPVANRLWNTKILWLIVMHPDDIAKVRFCFGYA